MAFAIAGLTAFSTAATAQGSKVISLRDAQRWQQLQGDAETQLGKGDYTQAESLARQAVAAGLAGFGPGDPNVAASYAVQGGAQLKNSNISDAEASFRQALGIYEKRFGPEHEFVGAMLNNLGLVLERQGNFSGAELLLRRALAIKEKKQGKNNPDTAVTLANLARVLDRQGKSGQLAQAGATSPAPGAPAGSAEAQQLVAQAQSAASQGDFSQAEALHRRALAVHEKELGPEHPTTLATLTNLGNVMLLQGKFKQAEQLFRRVLAAREKVLGPEHPDTAVSLNNVANALFEQFKQDEMNSPPSRRLRTTGANQQQTPEAETLYRRALAIQEKQLGPNHPALAATLNNLAVLLAGRGMYPDAEAMHKRAIAIAEKSLGPNHPDTAAMLTALAITYDRQGKNGDAEALYSRAVAIARDAKLPRNLLVNASSMGYSLTRRGRLRDALPYYREAVDALEAMYTQTRGLSEESRQAFLGQFAYVYRELVRILVTLHASEPAVGYDREALAVVSRSQSRVFSEMLKQADVARFSSTPVFMQLKQKRESLQERVGALRFAYLSVAESQAGAAGQRAEIGRQTQQVEAELKQTEDQLWRDYPRYMELASPRPVTADDLQKRLLKDGEALVTFALLPSEAVVFAVTRDKFRMVTVKVPREEFGRRVARIRRPMEQVAQGEPLTVLRQIDPEVLQSLYRDLLAPVADMLKGTRQVLVAADGPLYTLPFELMLTRYGDAERSKFESLRAASDGTPAHPFLGEYASLPYLGHELRFVYLPSLAALVSQRSNPKPPARYGQQLVAFADAMFGGEAGDAGYNANTRTLLGVLAASAPGGAPRIPRLPETAQEARDASAVVGTPSQIFLRRDAQEKRVKSGALKDARYVLFATHGFLGADFLQNIDLTLDADGNVIRSAANKGALAQPALALTLTGDLQGEDGLLSMKEVIEDVELNAELVVLSACNTAGETAATSNGEGFAGLTRAFMYAGAQKLMVSHWSVESASTQALVSGTFREVKAGKAPVDALAAAEQALSATSETADGRNFSRAHPFFWAPFVVVGD
ncbi:MAG TPA: CHAT domain-containing tetratricopeptide repeat protein [Burkholderiales bacterium]|nr:CHAT domain-containing tetratricopeptide repeat protein [Burkholderiales bacterium]